LAVISKWIFSGFAIEWQMTLHHCMTFSDRCWYWDWLWHPEFIRL